MIKPRPTQLTLLAGLVLVADAVPTLAQNWTPVTEETHWLSFQPNYASVGVFAESYNEDVSLNGGSSFKQSRTFVGPSIDLGVSGSIYHPNLAAYRVTLDGALGWSEETYRGNGQSSSSSELRFLGTMAAGLQLLDSKPFHADLYGNYTHSYQDYDFFNRIYVDTWRYGGGAYYTTGPWKFSGHVYRVTEDTTGNLVPRSSDTRTADFEVTHSRDHGSTSLAATASDYERSDAGFNNNGRDYFVSLSDSEDFGNRKQYRSVIGANYSHLESSSTPTEIYNLTENLRMELTPRLTSQNFFSYSQNNYGNSAYETLNGSSSLQHQLYDSLTSTLTVQGYRYSITSGPNNQDSWQLGVGPGFNYVKRFSPGSSVSVYDTIGIFHTEVQSSGGIITINAEPHSFGTVPGAGYFTLHQNSVVLDSINVTDTPNGSITNFIRGIDYDVVPNGQLVLIQRLPGSTLPDAVFVHYQYDSGQSGVYDTINNSAGIRFNFFHNHWSIYARLNLNRNYGNSDIVVQDLNDLVVGTEVNWRFLQAGGEYEDYDSTLSPYETWRLFQVFTFRPDDASTMSLNFTEAFIRYARAGREEQNYRAVFRYNRRLTHRLGANLDLGINQRIGTGVDQTLAVVRPELRYAVGKFSVNVGYDFGYDEYLNSQKRISNRAFLRMQKDF